MGELNVVPNPKSMFLDVSLYEPFELTLESLPEFMEIVDFKESIDCYCLKCNKESTFQSISYTVSAPKAFMSHTLEDLRKNVARIIEVKEEVVFENIDKDLRKFLSVELEKLKRSFNYVYKHFSCTRHKEHTISFTFVVDNGVFSKIGQYPSVADLNTMDIKKYRKVLKDKYNEFNKGVGLASHGVGIGSFVYLRRIFESLIEEAHITQKNSPNWDEDLYSNSKMDNRIKMLESILPEFLVRNRSIYGILSAGIHELSEEQCLNIFPDVKLGIELILDEKLYQFERENKIRTASAKLSKIHESMKSKNL